MKRSYNVFLLLVLLFCAISCVSESSHRAYKKIEILYDSLLFPWQYISIMSLTPYQYLEYTPDILEIEVKDSTTIGYIDKCISELNGGELRSFDTWFVMIIQDENNQLDTIGVAPCAIWKNGEVYNDTTLVDLVVGIIASKDTVWQERLDKYKTDGTYQIRSAALIDAGVMKTSVY